MGLLSGVEEIASRPSVARNDTTINKGTARCALTGPSEYAGHGDNHRLFC